MKSLTYDYYPHLTVLQITPTQTKSFFNYAIFSKSRGSTTQHFRISCGDKVCQMPQLFILGCYPLLYLWYWDFFFAVLPTVEFVIARVDHHLVLKWYTNTSNLVAFSCSSVKTFVAFSHELVATLVMVFWFDGTSCFKNVWVVDFDLWMTTMLPLPLEVISALALVCIWRRKPSELAPDSLNAKLLHFLAWPHL